MKIRNLFRKKGQSLVEIIVSMAVGTLIIGSAVGALIVTIRSNLVNRDTNFAATLGQDLLDSVGAVAEGNWVQVYEIPRVGGVSADISLASPKEMTGETLLSGKVYVDNGATVVNGDGSANFSGELVAGDFIDISGRTYKVMLPIGVNSLTLTSPYTGSSITLAQAIKAVKLTGTVTVDGTANVAGAGTAFPADLAGGDYIKIAGQIVKVSSVNTNTSLTLTSDYPGTSGEGLRIYREFGARNTAENIIPSGSTVTYTRSFTIEDVRRGNCGTGSITTNPLSAICSSINNAGDVFNVSARVNPSENKVCLVEGNLSFNNLSCQSISLSDGIIAQSAPTCSNPYFLLGIPGCTTTDKAIFIVSAKAKFVGTIKKNNKLSNKLITSRFFLF